MSLLTVTKGFWGLVLWSTFKYIQDFVVLGIFFLRKYVIDMLLGFKLNFHEFSDIKTSNKSAFELLNFENDDKNNEENSLIQYSSACLHSFSFSFFTLAK